MPCITFLYINALAHSAVHLSLRSKNETSPRGEPDRSQLHLVGTCNCREISIVKERCSCAILYCGQQLRFEGFMRCHVQPFFF